LKSYIISSSYSQRKPTKNVIINFLRRERHLTYITHGVLEHGADVLMFLDPDEDFLGRGQLTFIQVKRGDVTTDQ
jgi:hypothetical protein